MWYLILNGKKQNQAFYFAQEEDVERIAHKVLKEAKAFEGAWEGTQATVSGKVRYFYAKGPRYQVLQVVARPVDDACQGVNLL